MSKILFRSPATEATGARAISVRKGKAALSKTLTLTGLALASFLASSLPASAGPDDGKIVATQAHIDAPQTVWENNSFSLYAKLARGEQKDALIPFDQSVLWVGKGWSVPSRWSGPVALNQYIFTVPDSPTASFLGEPGQHLYMAPALPTGNHNPTWTGYGADINIPADQFRDGTFTLDLLEVKGPGTVEFFSYREGRYPRDMERMLSSADPDFQSVQLTPGAHTHNYTTFSRPGRYEITYRTVARSHDGKTIESKPTTAVWQVGGQKPLEGDGTATSTSVRQAYDQAPAADLGAAGYTLTLEPKKDQSQDGDDKLTDITFTALNRNLKGTLTLYVNGYFLTDLEVTGGTATWSEMLGSLDSQVQAVFVPEGQQDARWVSPALTHTPGATASVASSQGEGSWPQEQNDPANTTLPTGHYTPSSGDYTISMTPSGIEDYNRVDIRFADPKFRGFINGGMYGEAGDENPWSGCNAHINNGLATCYLTGDSWLNDSHAIFTVVPHPDMNARTQTHHLTDSYQLGQSYQGKGSLELDLSSTPSLPASPPADPTASPSPTPAQPTSTAQPTNSPSPTPIGSTSPAPSNPSAQQCLAPGLENRYLISEGHIDIKANLAGGALSLALKDDSGAIDRRTVERSLEDVVLAVRESAKFPRTAQLMDPALDFLGEEGSFFYGLPQTQQTGLLWPGWNTQDIDYSQLAGPVTLHLLPHEQPEGGNYGVYEQDFDGKINMLASSSTGDTSIDVDFATHVHANWVFSQPGTYAFDVYYSAPLPDGTQAKSQTQRMVYAVGQKAIQDCLTAAEITPAPEPTEQPSTEPSLQASHEPSLLPTAESSAAPIEESSLQPTTEPSTAPTGQATLRAGEPTVPSGGASVPVTGNQSQQSTGKGGSLASTGASVVGVATAGALALGAGFLALRRRQR